MSIFKRTVKTEEPVVKGGLDPGLADEKAGGLNTDFMDEIIGGNPQKTGDTEVFSLDFLEDVVARQDKTGIGDISKKKPVVEQIIEEETKGLSTLKELDATLVRDLLTHVDIADAARFIARDYTLESINKILSVDYFISANREEIVPKNLFEVLRDKEIAIKDWAAYFTYAMKDSLENLAAGMKLYNAEPVTDPSLAYPRIKIKKALDEKVVAVLQGYLNGAKEKSELKKILFLGNLLSLNPKLDTKENVANLVKETVAYVAGEIAKTNIEFRETSSVSPYLIKAVMDLNGGRLKNASAIVEKVLEKDYKNIAAKYLRVLVNGAAKGDEAALQAVDNFLEEHADYSPAVFYKARVLKSLNRLEESVGILERLVKADDKKAKQEIFSIFMGLGVRDTKTLFAKADQFLGNYLATEAGLPETEKIYFQKGMLNRELGKRDAAIEDFDAAFRANSTFYEALKEKCTLQRIQGNFSGAKKDLTHLIETAAGDKSPFFFELGLTLFEEGKSEEAYEQLQNAKKEGIESRMALNIELYQAESLQRIIQAGSHTAEAKAEKSAKAMSHLANARGISGSNYRIYLIGGKLHNLFGRESEAVESFREGLKLDNRNIALLAELGKTLYNTGKVREAKESFVAISELAGNNSEQKSEIAYRIGICNFDLGNYVEVVKSFNELFDRKAKVGGTEADRNQVLLYMLGESLYHTRDYKNAVKPLEQFIALKGPTHDDESVNAYSMLGDCYFESSDLEMAKRSYKVVLDHREDGELIFKMALIHDVEKSPRALELYKQAIEKNTSKDIVSKCWFNLGKMYLEKDNAEAIKALEISLELSPNNRDAYMILAGMFANHNPSKSNHYLERALEHFPGDEGIIMQQNSQLEILGEKEKILANLEKLIGKNPHNVQYFRKKAEVLEMLNRYDDAESVLEEANRIGGGR